jgi:signal transduction histidine kinase
VIRNLLDNAERHARAAVVVGLSTEDDMLDLVVADDGDGIPLAHREQVFERFFRLQDARDRDSGGAGLGLAIVRDIVASHGGRTWLAETPTGAEFHASLRLVGATPSTGS